MNFRDFERKLCVITGRRFLFTFDPDRETDANRLLCYGYVDHTAGLTFEGLALVKYGDGDCVVVKEDNTAVAKIRANSVDLDDVDIIQNEDYLKRFSERIKSIDIYYENKDAVHSRAFDALDVLRHPLYPDDVYVLFPTEDLKDGEKMWVRTEKYLGKDGLMLFFAGRLLNEPNRNLGCHINDTVTFALLQNEKGDKILVWMR